MSQTFHHKGRRVDCDLWALPDMDLTLDFDLVASYAITGVWRFVPKDRLSDDTRTTIEGHLQDENASWAGIVVGVTAVVVVNIVGATLVAAGAYFAAPMLASVGTALLGIPDILVYKIGYEIGDYFYG